MRRFLIGFIVASIAVVGIAQPASAREPETLCESYRWNCDGGLGYNPRKMYWSQLPGHNCTNYVAFRLIKNGAPADLGPFGGNAGVWDNHFKNTKYKVNQIPMVGAVAHWNAYENGMRSSRGHVAYVDEVGPDYIIIDEDNWGGKHTRKKIYKNGRLWPGRFIHIHSVDEAMEKHSNRVVTAKGKDGNTWFITENMERLPVKSKTAKRCLVKVNAKKPAVLAPFRVQLIPKEKKKFAACGNALKKRQTLMQGMHLHSADRSFELRLLDSGDLVLVSSTGVELWAVRDYNIDHVYLKKNGNFVAFSKKNKVVWSTKTRNSKGSVLKVTSSGQVVLKDSKNRVIWSTEVDINAAIDALDDNPTPTPQPSA